MSFHKNYFFINCFNSSSPVSYKKAISLQGHSIKYIVNICFVIGFQINKRIPFAKCGISGFRYLWSRIQPYDVTIFLSNFNTCMVHLISADAQLFYLGLIVIRNKVSVYVFSKYLPIHYKIKKFQVKLITS
jgi:hypothetical protein